MSDASGDLSQADSAAGGPKSVPTPSYSFLHNPPTWPGLCNLSDSSKIVKKRDRHWDRQKGRDGTATRKVCCASPEVQTNANWLLGNSKEALNFRRCSDRRHAAIAAPLLRVPSSGVSPIALGGRWLPLFSGMHYSQRGVRRVPSFVPISTSLRIYGGLAVLRYTSSDCRLSCPSSATKTHLKKDKMGKRSLCFVRYETISFQALPFFYLQIP